MRLNDWQSRLSMTIHARREVPFDFANWNCLMWAADAIIACKGEDVLANYRGKYKDEKSAARLLRRIDGVKTSQSFLEKKLGIKARAIAFARPGDIVLVNPSEAELELPADIDLFGLVPGICYGSISYFVGKDGLVEVPTLTLGQALWVS